MKKKKQTRKIKKWLVAALGLTLLGTGLWAGMNGEKLQAKPKTMDFQNISLEPKVAGWPFLSEGVLGDGSTLESVWQNMETATIPAENSLVFKGPLAGETDMSKIRSSGLDFESYPIKERVAKYKLSPDPQWLEIDDVGYYQGKRIGLRVIVQLINPPSSIPTTPLPNGKLPDMGEAFMGYASGHFASVSVPSWLSNGANVTYEVYDVDDSTRKAIPFSGYFPLAPSFESTRISILNWTQIVNSGNHIYSASATSTPRTQVQYQLQENVLTFARDPLIVGDADSVFTFTNQSSLRFRLFSVYEDNTPYKNNDALVYKSQIAMRIAIPNPEPLKVPDVKEVKADTEMNYQFNQQIPPEPTSKRDQRVQWTLKTDDNKTVVPDVDASGTLKSWTVSDLDGNDMTSKFEVTSFNESTNEVTIAPKEAQYTDDSFYNHYYTFKSKLKIDYTKPIDEKLLKDRDGGKYLDKTGTVTLAVNGVAREEQEFKTSINFASKVNYAYLLQGTSTAVPGFTPTAAQKTGDGIITHAAALTPPSPIGTANKYHYASVEPANKIIKYSEQDMKFYYVEDAEPWLPYYKPGLGIGGGGWLDSIQSYIPKGSSFAMMYLPGKTAVGDKVGIDYSAGFTIPRDENGKLKPGNATFLTGKDRVEWIKVANVGYYQGRFVDVKVTIKTQEAGRDEKYPAFLQLDDSSAFMTIRMDHYSKAMDISYEFFYSDGTMLNGMQLYWDKFSDDSSYTVIDQSLIKNVYSVSREYKVGELALPTHLIYQNPSPNEFVLRSSGIDTAASYQHNRVRSRATFSYLNPTGNFEFKYISTVEPRESAGAQLFAYNYDTLVKIEIPDPMEQSQVYPEIIGQNQGILKNESENKVEKLYYGFVQHMPWESKIDTLEINNRTQKPSWELNPIGTTSAVTTSEWEVVPQDLAEGTNSTEMFDTSGVDESGKGIIKPKESELAEDEFYNHYYKFNRSLNIDYENPIARTSLKAKDGRYYFDYSGKVELAVDDTNPTPEQEAGMNKNREEVKYDTAINFLADDVQYKYLDKTIYDAQITAGKTESEARAAAAINFGGLTWDETPQPSGKGQAIVTWQVPLTPTTYTAANLADPGTPESETNKAPTIPGYEYVAKSAKLNGQTADYQVKVTKFLADGKTETDATAADYTKPNEVVLFYEPQGDVEIEEKDEEGVVTYLADDIDFGNITVPATSTITKQPEKVNGAGKDQYPSLVVKDTRLKNYRKAGWTLYVKMDETFRLKREDGTFDDAVTVDNILKYKNNFSFVRDGKEESPDPIAITKGDKIPIESLIPAAAQLDETIWRTTVELGADKENGEASKGFYLEINKPTQLRIKAGEYQAELTFSVENSAFTTSPGRSK